MSNIIGVEVSDTDLQNLGFIKLYLDSDIKLEVGIEFGKQREYINIQDVPATELGLREFIKIQCVRAVIKKLEQGQDLARWYYSGAVFGIKRDQQSTVIPIMQINMICSFTENQFDVLSDCIYQKQQFQQKHLITFQDKEKGLCDAILLPLNIILGKQALIESQRIMPYKIK